MWLSLNSEPYAPLELHRGFELDSQASGPIVLSLAADQVSLWAWSP
jgi:hypothetical protein